MFDFQCRPFWYQAFWRSVTFLFKSLQIILQKVKTECWLLSINWHFCKLNQSYLAIKWKSGLGGVTLITRMFSSFSNSLDLIPHTKQVLFLFGLALSSIFTVYSLVFWSFKFLVKPEKFGANNFKIQVCFLINLYDPYF